MRLLGLLWLSDQPVAEPATYEVQNKHKRLTSTHLAENETATPTIKRQKTYVLNRKATKIRKTIRTGSLKLIFSERHKTFFETFELNIM